AGEGRKHLLVEAADHDGVGLAARVPHRLQHGLEVGLGEQALSAVGAGAGAVRRRRIGAGGALRRVALDPRQHRGGLARSGVVAGHLGLVVPMMIDSMSRLSSSPLSISWYSSSSSRPACSTARWVPVTRATLSEIWQMLPSRTVGVAASVVASSPSSTALV